MRRNSSAWMTMVFVLLSISRGLSQADNLQVQNVTVVVTDKSGRLFDAGTVEITLISAPGFENGQTLGTETVQFNVGEAAKSFPIREGRADTRLLIQGDPSKDPFRYQLTGKGTNGLRFVSKNVEVSALTKTIALVAPDTRAPLNRLESAAGAAFVAFGCALVLLTFFYWGFRRMLFNRRMEVHSAVAISKIISWLYVLITVAIAAAAWFRPDLWTRATSTYLGLLLIFFALYGLGFFFLFFFTRARAVRS
jgi:hypothetical protein